MGLPGPESILDSRSAQKFSLWFDEYCVAGTAAPLARRLGPGLLADALPAGSDARPPLPRPAAAAFADEEPLTPPPSDDARIFFAGLPSPSSASVVRRCEVDAPVDALADDPAAQPSAAAGGVLSNELIATTSSLNTSCGSDLANSARDSLDRIYSAAQLNNNRLIDDPSGVSFHTCTNNGVAGICWVTRLHSAMASSVASHSPSIPRSCPSFHTPMRTS